MKKVITYGSYDMLHYGHVRLLERAKALGDYLIVGVTSDDYDKVRGKVNLQQTLMERVNAIKALGLADQIIVEEYDGQKIDDIQKYNVDVFAIGSDWLGKFDYLKEFCQVVYLERTQGISSSEIRAKNRHVRMGVVGDSNIVGKYWNEAQIVNGLEITALHSNSTVLCQKADENHIFIARKIEEMWDRVDALYVRVHPNVHYDILSQAFSHGKHVLCEAPVVHGGKQFEELVSLAQQQHCIFMPALKTAHATAYNRLRLLVKTGIIGKVTSIDANATSLRTAQENSVQNVWGAFDAWGPTVLLPIFQLFGLQYNNIDITVASDNANPTLDPFVHIKLCYPHCVASIKVAHGVKSEGSLVISGTTGYVYVPAPWWKTDYFEIRRENPTDNRRYFYALEGEGIRNELVDFIKAIEKGKESDNISKEIFVKISEIALRVYEQKDVSIITFN